MLAAPSADQLSGLSLTCSHNYLRNIVSSRKLLHVGDHSNEITVTVSASSGETPREGRFFLIMAAVMTERYRLLFLLLVL